MLLVIFLIRLKVFYLSSDRIGCGFRSRDSIAAEWLDIVFPLVGLDTREYFYCYWRFEWAGAVSRARQSDHKPSRYNKY